MGQNAVNFVLEKFSKKVIENKWKIIYEKLLRD
jgi:hypothetical protein